MVKEVILELENGEKKSDKQIIYKEIKIGKRDYKVIIETIPAKTRSRKKKLRNYVCNVFYR